MSFLNVGVDGPPNHNLEIEGSMFVANVEDGTYTPVETETKFRFRTKPPGTGSGDYIVSDIQINSSLFGISRPTNDASGNFTDFCIDGSKNIGIGTTPTKKLDVGGSMYASGTLTNESNIVTNSLTVNGTISSTRLVWGPNSNIYGFLPTGAILMTTLTAAPSGWTDVTDTLSFAGRNVLLAEDRPLTTTGGNDNGTLTSSIIHNHGTVTHSVSHTHTNPARALNSAGEHNHATNIGNSGIFSTDYHTHQARDIQMSNRLWGVNQGFPGYNTVTIMTTNGYRNNKVDDSGLHTHTIPDQFSGESKYGADGHSHNYILTVDNSGDTGGNHTHQTNSQGSSTEFSIIPPYYSLRFIQKN